MTGNRFLASVLAVAMSLALAVLGGCAASGGPTTNGPTSAPAGSTSVITIKDFAFTTPASVSPGATITVKNLDTTAHTVTADDGHSFDDQAQPGNSSFTAPTKPGSYPFHCSFHPEMHGVLVVT